MSDHTAAEQMVGYLYQMRYSLYMLTNEPDDDIQICVENYDDIASAKNNEIKEMVQLKHHAGNQGDLTDSSTDFWRTMKSWCDVIEEKHLEADKIKFLIVTTAKAPEKSAAYRLKDVNYGGANYQRDINAAYKALLYTSKHSDSKTNKPFYDKFNSMGEDKCKKLLENVYVLDKFDNIIDIKSSILRYIKIMTLPQYQDKIYERLEGWWFETVIECLQSPTVTFINKNQIRNKLSSIRDEYSSDSLPIDIPKDLSITQEELSDQDKIFIEQLKLISLSKNRINTAIKDYCKAYTQRGNWIRDGLLYPDELEDYEDSLIDEWQRCFDEMCEELEDDYGDDIEEVIKQKKGKELFNEVSDENINIRERCTAPFVMRGSYQMLANKLKVGWHIDFQRRLYELFRQAGVLNEKMGK